MYDVTLTESYFPAQEDGKLTDKTIGDILRDAAASSPNTLALKELPISGVIDRTWTYDELLTDAEKLAQALLSRHRPGDRIALWAPNIPEWVLIELGAALAGLTIVTVNPSYQPSELKYVLEQSQAATLYLVEEYRGNPMAENARSVIVDLPNVTALIDIEDHDALFDWDGETRQLPEVKPGDPVQIQYTSGTTGFPKGAVLHHRGIVNNSRQTLERLGMGPGDVYLNFMPMFHTGGCAVACLGSINQQGTMIIAALFDPNVMIQIIEQEKVNVFLGVPTMIIGLLEAQQTHAHDLSSVYTVCSGGSMVPPEIVRRAKAAFGANLQIIYGQTETSPVITCVWENDTLEDITGSVGQPMPYVEVAIIDPKTNKIAPIDTVGEICSRGYLNMIEYNDNPKATAETIDKEGWLHTGDLGTMDARGYVRVTGRVKEMIIRGGENLFPAEIENAMQEHRALAEIAVVGIPDDKWGEVVACFMRRAGHETPERDELIAHCRERLSPQKTPTIWIYVDDWPLTGSGKIQKFVLRDQFMEGQFAPL